MKRRSTAADRGPAVGFPRTADAAARSAPSSCRPLVQDDGAQTGRAADDRHLGAGSKTASVAVVMRLACKVRMSSSRKAAASRTRGVRARVVDLGHGEPGFGRQGLGAVQARSPAVGEQKSSARAGTRLRDPIGKGETEGRTRRRRLRRGQVLADEARQLPSDSFSLTAGRLGEAACEVDTAGPRVARAQTGRSRDRRGTQPVLSGREHHVREARMQRQVRHGAAVRRDHSVGGEGAQLAQQPAAGRERARRRQGRQAQPAGVGDAPGREFERQRRQVGLLDLGRSVRRPSPLLLHRPQPQAQAGAEPARPAGTLLGRRARDRHGDRAGSCRCGQRSAGAAPDRCRPQPRCRRWSGWSRRCWSPARPGGRHRAGSPRSCAARGRSP